MQQLTEAEAKSLFDECPEYWGGSFKVSYDMFVKYGKSPSLETYIGHFGKSFVIGVLHEEFNYNTNVTSKTLSGFA